MSAIRTISQKTSPVIRWLFTYRWKPMKIKKRDSNIFRSAWERYTGIFSWMKRNKRRTLVVLLIGFIIIPLTIGIVFRLGAPISIYDEFGVTELKMGFTGDIVTLPIIGTISWEDIWEFRGQPPGVEDNPDGLFVVKKLTPTVIGGKTFRGFNGPLNMYFLPFEFVIVDMMIYIPHILMGGMDILSNVDILMGYFFPIWLTNVPPVGRLYSMGPMSGGAFALLGLLVLIPIIIFIMLLPLIVGLYTVPVTQYLLTNIKNFVKLFIVLFLFMSFIIAPVIILNPDFVNEIKEIVESWFP